ncbi:MAG TPA: hypothetical protein VGH32_09295 [Pirellulales bacterium]
MPASTDRRLPTSRRASADNAQLVSIPPAPPPRGSAVSPIEGYDPNKVYGLTRRFSLATLMLMMAATSLLLAAMNALRVPPYLTGAMILLCIATAVGQMFLFRGEDPRQASLVVGLVCCPLLAIFMVKAGAAVTFRHPESGEVVAMVFVGLMFGAPFGYAAGCVVAGVLLLMDLTESKFARWRKVREPDDDPWPPPKSTRSDSLASSAPPGENVKRM